MEKEYQTVRQIITHLPPNITVEVIDEEKPEEEQLLYRGSVIKLYRDRDYSEITQRAVSLFNQYEKEEESSKGTKLRIATIYVQE